MVVDLDEVVRIGRPGIPATAIDLLLILTVVGGGGGCTLSVMVAVLLRTSASLMVADRDFAPGNVPPATVVWNEKIASPAMTSPWVPSS